MSFNLGIELLKSLKCSTCLHFPLCSSNRGGVDLQCVTTDEDCSHYTSVDEYNKKISGDIAKSIFTDLKSYNYVMSNDTLHRLINKYCDEEQFKMEMEASESYTHNIHPDVRL